MRRFVFRATLLIALLGSTLAVAAPAGHIQALCVNCFNFQCEYTTRDGHTNCTDFTGGCVASGECTLKLRFTP